MRKFCKIFSQNFKNKSDQFSDESLKQAGEIGITASQLCASRTEYEEAGEERFLEIIKFKQKSNLERIAELEIKLKIVEQERDMLKKSLDIFSKKVDDLYFHYKL